MAVGLLDMEEAEVVESRVRGARQILLQAALLGVLADRALRSASGGLGWALWVAGLAIATVIVVRFRGERMSREQIFWLALSTGCASAVAWRDAEMLQAVNVLGTLVALALFSMASAGAPAPSIFSSRVRDVVGSWVFAARDALMGALRLWFSEASLGSALRSTASARQPAIRAALLTIPLVIVFSSLLARADPVFGAIFRLPGIRAEEIVPHLVLGGVFAWLSAGWMRGALLRPGNRPALPDQLPFSLGVTEITTSLGALVAIFSLFVAIQLRWLFGGADVVLATTGLTLAEYARRGFFEMVMVAALALPLILGTRAATVEEGAIRRHRRLSQAMLVLLGAIMASAALRMNLYVSNFGLTEDRLYALVFMLWLALVFLTLAITVLRGWPRPFAAVAVVSAFATLFVLNAMNPDALIARLNLGRTAAARDVDFTYLARLSGDAMPAVAPALGAAAPAETTCAAAKSLRRRWLKTHDRSNLGTSRGRDAVIDHLPPQQVLRLCRVS